jgi:hypothetical protein
MGPPCRSRRETLAPVILVKPQRPARWDGGNGKIYRSVVYSLNPRELESLELVLRMIKRLEAERNAIAFQGRKAHGNARQIQDLVKLKAIGPEFAAVLTEKCFTVPSTIAGKSQVLLD